MMSSEKRLVKSKSGLRILHVKDSERSPFELSEPEWMKDNQSSACLACDANFDFIRRKHHCRRCGRLYCNACSKTKLSLPRMCFLDPVRLCFTCAKTTNDENAFYEKDLKLLIAGVLLEVSDVNPDSEVELLHCCLSPNHRHLVLSGSSLNQSIPLTNITAFSKSENDENGNLISFSFSVNDEGPARELKVPSDSTNNAQSFICSLQKAFEMANEAKAIIGTGN